MALPFERSHQETLISGGFPVPRRLDWTVSDLDSRSLRLESVIEFSIGKKTSVSGDLGAVELQLQAAVKIDPKAPLFRFAHRVRHGLTAKVVIRH